MIILGWTSADYRGRKEWAALWNAQVNDVTQDDLDNVAAFKLDNSCLHCFEDTLSLAEAKARVLESLRAVYA